MSTVKRRESWNRRAFLGALGAAVAGAPGAAAEAIGTRRRPGPGALSAATRRQAQVQPGKPRAHEFVFARLRYASGDWDYNPKVAANVLDAVVQYTNIPVYPEEVVITADSDELLAFPFLFMTGHKLVRFSDAERANLVRFVEAGGLLFSDDCNHDVDGLYALSFEEEMRRTFDTPGPVDEVLPKLPDDHALYRSFFHWPEGPPQTSHELNGWGDDMIHEYLRGIERNGRLGVLYSNKDYGCEWDYEWRNKRFRREDNTRFAVNIVVYAMT